MVSDQEEMEYGFTYNAKDLILYALSIGIGASEEDAENLRFLYERHPRFASVPTFCLALTFWVDKGESSTTGIPSFPPPIMTKEEVIPRKFLLGGDVNLSKFPVIHTWQSIVWEQSLPVPAPGTSTSRCDNVVPTKMNMQTISVVPKSIGTFVTSQSKVAALDPKTKGYSRICTMQSTALVLGVAKENVAPYEDSAIARLTSKPRIPEDQPTILEWTYPTISSQALLYRLASGDSNRIHVDTSASEMLGSEKKAPLLHGLFTLAVAFRAILKLINSADKTIRRLEGKFVQPAFVGDVLSVKVWKDEASSSGNFVFIVVNKDTGVTLVDCGYAEIGLHDKPTEVTKSRL
jgi:acyl dehydratase